MIVTTLDSIPPGEGRTFQLSGQRIAIFRGRNGQVFATQADCPHKGGPLADGLLGGTTLICPLHTWRWDLSTGETLLGDCPLTIFPARVDDANRIVVTLPSEAQ